jgi:hypothetical protein
MTGCGRLAAGCAAAILLLPGLCFLYAGGVQLSSAPQHRGIDLSTAIEFIIVGLVLLGLVVVLVRMAVHEPELWIRRQTEGRPEKPEPPKAE